MDASNWISFSPRARSWAMAIIACRCRDFIYAAPAPILGVGLPARQAITRRAKFCGISDGSSDVRARLARLCGDELKPQLAFGIARRHSLKAAAIAEDQDNFGAGGGNGIAYHLGSAGRDIHDRAGQGDV